MGFLCRSIINGGVTKLSLKKELAREIIKRWLRKQGLGEHWGWGYVEYGEPYRHVPASHAMGVGGVDTEGKFVVPAKRPKDFVDAPDGRIAQENWETLYDLSILSPKKTYNIDDELKSLIAQLVGKGKKKS